MGLDLVEIVLECEDHFGISLPDADCRKAESVQDFARLIRSQLAARAGQVPTEADVIDQVRLITSEQMRIPLEHIRPESRFVRDLRIH